jgi:glycosyltransferase involved in cell wall biosynthesis
MIDESDHIHAGTAVDNEFSQSKCLLSRLSLMSKLPEISVVIPAYNASRFIGETLEGVLSQTHKAKEVIVVDDGSQDDTAAMVLRFSESVRLVRQENAGESRARNVGRSMASGDWIAFLDSDDVWEKDMLYECATTALQHPHAQFIFTNYRTFGSESKECDSVRQFEIWNRDMYLLVPFVTVLPSASIINKEVSIEWPERTKNLEDALFFNQLVEMGEAVGIPKYLVRYRRHAASQQRQANAQEKAFASLLQEYTDDPVKCKKLQNTLLHLLQSRWYARDWESFDRLKVLFAEKWPEKLESEPILTRRRFPRFTYRLKDTFDLWKSK